MKVQGGLPQRYQGQVVEDKTEMTTVVHQFPGGLFLFAVAEQSGDVTANRTGEKA
jgi:hypothetical protein